MRHSIFIFLSLFFFSNDSFSQCQIGERYMSQKFSSYDLETYKYGENTDYKGDLIELNVDVYTPVGDTVTDRPLIVFCFGGAFVSGTKKSPEIVLLADSITRKGYVCASIDYRLDDRDNMALNGEAKAVIRGVQDAKAAIRYLKSKHSEIGFDTSRIVIGGTSAGGVIALTIGYSDYMEFPKIIRDTIDALGGYEGNTNNLSHTSDVIGMFNFSGAILDTNHIQANDLPVYLNHALGDSVVPFYSGLPLNGAASTIMHGSGSVLSRIKNVGGTVTIDSFSGGLHPSFINIFLLPSLENTLAQFLCETTYKSASNPVDTNGSSSIHSIENEEFIYVNSLNELVINKKSNNKLIYISDLSGRLWEKQIIDKKVDVSYFTNGIYFIRIDDRNYKVRF